MYHEARRRPRIVFGCLVTWLLGYLVTWLLGAPLPRPLGEERGLGGKVRAGGEGTGYWVLGIGYLVAWLPGWLVTWVFGAPSPHLVGSRGGALLRPGMHTEPQRARGGNRARHALPLHKKSAEIGGPICVHLPSSAPICVPFTTTPKITPAPPRHAQFPRARPHPPVSPPLPAGEGG